MKFQKNVKSSFFIMVLICSFIDISNIGKFEENDLNSSESSEEFEIKSNFESLIVLDECPNPGECDPWG